MDGVFGKADGGILSGVMPSSKQAQVKYWLTREGRIQTGPVFETSGSRFKAVRDKGWKELPDSFGREQSNIRGATMDPLYRSTERPHTWLQRFFENGGLTYICQPNDGFGVPGQYLMPKEQIVEMNLHRLPGVREVRPDLETATDVSCPYGCIDEATRGPRLFSGVNEDAANRSRDQHIIAVHRDAMATRAMGQEMTKAIEQVGGNQLNPELIASIAAAVASVMKTGEIPKNLKPHVVKPPAPVKPPLAEGMPDGTWKRQQLMSYAAQNGVPRGEGFMAKSTPQMLQHILDHLPHESLPEEDSGLQE